MIKIRMVINDWNGCMLNDVPHRFEHGPKAIFKHFGLPEPSLLDYCQHITSDFMKYYYDRGIPNSGDKKADGDLLNKIMTDNMSKAPIPPLFPETESFLSTLRQGGVLQVLVSAMEENEFKRQVNHHDLGIFFEEMHGGIRGKAAVFNELLMKYATAPVEAIGVTDTMSDARELFTVGVKPIIIPRGYSVPNTTEVPTLIVANDLNEALEHIKW